MGATNFDFLRSPGLFLKMMAKLIKSNIESSASFLLYLLSNIATHDNFDLTWSGGI